MDQETHRECSKCKRVKLIDEYHWRDKRKGTRRRECKECASIVKNANGKRNYSENKAYYKAKNARWFRENAAYMKNKRRARYIEDKEKVRVQTRIYRKHRRATDATFRLKSVLRTRCNNAVRNCNTHKSARTFELIGCTPIQLRLHLEQRFYGGMTWDKLGVGPGTFQIDHIEPVGMFDLTDPKQQRRCFHYSNLQPLWYEDHQAKTVVDNLRIRNQKNTITNLCSPDQIRAASVSA